MERTGYRLPLGPVANAGIALLQGAAQRVQLTVIAQALQVIRISSGSLAYSFLAGLAFWIELGTAGLRVPGLRFGDSFRWMTPGGFGAGAPSEPFTLGVNLVAAAILLYFLRGGRSGKKQNVQLTQAAQYLLGQVPRAARTPVRNGLLTRAAHRVARSKPADAIGPEDLLQETFVNFERALSTFAGMQPGNLPVSILRAISSKLS